MSGFAERRRTRALAPADARSTWAAVVAAARRLTGGAGEERATALVAHQAKGLTATTFPVGEASARLMAGALLDQLHALRVAALPERRAAIGPCLMATAAVLEELIHAERTRLAETHWTSHAGGGGGA